MRFFRGDRTPTGEVAPRDASWYNRPDVNSDKALHVVCADGMSACGVPVDAEHGAMLATKTKTVCGRPACQRAFPEALRLAQQA